MKIELYPKNILEALWKKDKKWFSDGNGQRPVCLRCGNPLNDRLMVNSLSRHAKIYICQQCGSDEAMRDYGKAVMPKSGIRHTPSFITAISESIIWTMSSSVQSARHRK